MLKKFSVYPVVWVVSLVGEITRDVGKAVPIHRLYRWLFDLLIGVEDARKWRDGHVDIVACHVADSDDEIDEPKEELAAEVKDRWQNTEKHISNGESVLGFGIAVASFFSSPWIAAALAAILIVSVSVRLAAVEALAYTDSDPEKTHERLKAEAAWNGGVLARTRVTSNLLAMRIMREMDERFYEIWLDEIFGPVFSGERSAKEAVKRWWGKALEITVSEHRDGEKDGGEGSEETEATEATT